MKIRRVGGEFCSIRTNGHDEGKSRERAWKWIKAPVDVNTKENKPESSKEMSVY
jgi:hypothetical protein